MKLAVCPHVVLFYHQKITEKVDVYALAMVYYYLLARHPPYKGLENATDMIKNGISPPTDPSWNAKFLEVGRRIGIQDPGSRTKG